MCCSAVRSVAEPIAAWTPDTEHWTQVQIEKHKFTHTHTHLQCRQPYSLGSFCTSLSSTGQQLFVHSCAWINGQRVHLHGSRRAEQFFLPARNRSVSNLLFRFLQIGNSFRSCPFGRTIPGSNHICTMDTTVYSVQRGEGKGRGVEGLPTGAELHNPNCSQQSC